MEIFKPQDIRIDDRGSFTQVVQGEFRQLSIIELKKDASRGSHYHKVTRELFYVFKGKVKVVNVNVDTNEKEDVDVEAGYGFMIEPLWFHTVYGLKDSSLIVLPSKAYDSNDEDIYYLDK